MRVTCQGRCATELCLLWAFSRMGKPFDLKGKTAFSLCRCGHSANKPFCDGTYGKVGFQAEELRQEWKARNPSIVWWFEFSNA